MVFLEGSEEALAALSLDRDVAQANAAFFYAYARQIDAASERARSPQLERDGWAALLRTSEPWVKHGVLATTYRQAAQFRCLVDLESAIPLMQRSAEEYLAAGNPFGLFLITATMDSQQAGEALMDPRHLGGLSRERVESGVFSMAALGDPVQRTYLLLAYCMHPVVGRELVRLLEREHEVLLPHSRHPIGPQSAPLAQYLTLCEFAISRIGSLDEDHRDTNRIARLIITLAQQQAAALRSAQGNRYLWERGAAPVNYCDLELIALIAQSIRGSGAPAFMFDQLSRLTADHLAAVSLWAGAELFRRAGGEDEGAHE